MGLGRWDSRKASSLALKALVFLGECVISPRVGRRERAAAEELRGRVVTRVEARRRPKKVGVIVGRGGGVVVVAELHGARCKMQERWNGKMQEKTVVKTGQEQRRGEEAKSESRVKEETR